MKPRRAYWLGFVLLLASGGLAQSQRDARDVPNKFSEGEEFSQGGTLTAWVPDIYVMGQMNDSTVRVINTYPWGILQSQFKRDFPNFDLDFKILDRDEFVRIFHSSQPDASYPDVAFCSFLRRTSEQRIRHIGVSFHVEPLALQAKSKAQ